MSRRDKLSMTHKNDDKELFPHSKGKSKKHLKKKHHKKKAKMY